jgi:N-acetylglucosaminyl-diphospho-decaprenol L-rhamnosyltransferase
VTLPARPTDGTVPPPPHPPVAGAGGGTASVVEASRRTSGGDAVDIALIVVTYNSAPHIGPLLASVDAALGPLRARLVFVDNASNDDTVDRLRQLAGPRAEVIVRSDNRGYAAAINAGFRHTADAPAILVLNPDVSLGAGSIPALLATSRAPGVGVVVPQMRTPGGAIYRSLRREPTVARALGAAVIGGRLAARFPHWSEIVGDHRTYLGPCDVDWATGAAMLVTRSCADATGAWDESFFLYSEETDFAHRARGAGFRIRYEPAAVVTHTGGDCMTSPRLRTMLTLSRLRYYRRRHGRVRSAAFYAAVLLNEATRGLVGDRAALAAARALVRPGARPPELACSDSLVPG